MLPRHPLDRRPTSAAFGSHRSPSTPSVTAAGNPPTRVAIRGIRSERQLDDAGLARGAIREEGRVRRAEEQRASSFGTKRSRISTLSPRPRSWAWPAARPRRCPTLDPPRRDARRLRGRRGQAPRVQCRRPCTGGSRRTSEGAGPDPHGGSARRRPRSRRAARRTPMHRSVDGTPRARAPTRGRGRRARRAGGERASRSGPRGATSSPSVAGRRAPAHAAVRCGR